MVPAPPPPTARRAAGFARLALGAAVLVVTVLLVERYVGWGRLLEPWRTLAPGTLAAAVALVLASYGMRAVRVYDHFRPATRGRMGACLRLTLIHNLLNNLVPMRLGEASFPALLRRYFQVPLARGVAGLVWFRLTDLHVLVAIAFLALGRDHLPGAALVLLLGAWMLIPWVVFRARAPAERALARWVHGRLAHWLREGLHGMPPDGPTFWRTGLWTLLNWALKLAVFAWLLQAFARIELAPALMGSLGGELSSVLPMHGLAGAGTYEAGVVAALAPFRVAPVEALAAAVNLHLFLLGVSGLGGALALALRSGRGDR
jgi:uncharacterized membrane protein YbhN (UPF0104 family)